VYAAEPLLKIGPLCPPRSRLCLVSTAVCTRVRTRPGQPDSMLLYPSPSSSCFTGDVHDPRFEILLSNWELGSDSVSRTLPVTAGHAAPCGLSAGVQGPWLGRWPALCGADDLGLSKSSRRTRDLRGRDSLQENGPGILT